MRAAAHLAAVAMVAGLAMASPACRAPARSGTRVAPGLPPSQVGLVKEPIDRVPVPPAVAFNTSSPGERVPAARPYAGAPPTIPHGIADFLPITRDQNACIECHAVEEKVEGEPTPIPESHHIDLRNDPEKLRPTVSGARYNCITCHASQTDAKPLPGG